jgi:hypothetical protein
MPLIRTGLLKGKSTADRREIGDGMYVVTCVTLRPRSLSTRHRLHDGKPDLRCELPRGSAPC